MLKYFYVIAGLLIGSGIGLHAQTNRIEGEVSFVSSRNVYVKFVSTESMATGDTLFQSEGEAMIPVLIITNKSSTSVVTTPIGDHNFVKGDRVYFPSPEIELTEEDTEAIPSLDSSLVVSGAPLVITPEEDEVKPFKRVKQGLSGRVSAATYSSLNQGNDNHRFRYQFNLQANRIKNSGLSFDSYVVFRHRAGAWDEVQSDLASALKIYNLSALYEFNSTTRMSFGRRINPRFSNMGAVDGLQMEKEFGRFSVGLIAGSRPDFENYGINPALFEYGIFAGINAKPGTASSMTTLAFVEQTNSGNTDRRFFFLQHSGNVTDNIFFLSSFEVDLYEKIGEVVSNQPHLTNLFVSARWRASRKLNLSGSYDNRKNIIFYESYKNYIDQLIDNETRQGLRFGANVRPWSRFSFSGNFNWRFQASGVNDSKNINGQFRFTNPWGKGSGIALRANWLETGFMSSKMLGLRINQSLFKQIVDTDLYARMVSYSYSTTGLDRIQYIAGLNLDINLTKTLGLYLYGEGTLNNDNNLAWLFNTRLVKRIK